MAIYTPQARQFGALYGRNRRIPYRAFIESQIPSLYTRKKYQEDKELADQQLALDRSALDLSGRQLEEGARQSEANLALNREQMEQAERQGKLGLGISAAQTGVLGGYLAKKAGLFGLGKAATTTAPSVTSAGVGPTATTTGGAGFEAFSTAPSAGVTTGAGGGTVGPMTPNMASGVIGAGIMAAPVLGPVVVPAAKKIAGSLFGYGKQTAPGPGNYTQILSGKTPSSSWDENAKAQLDNLLSGYSKNPALFTMKPVEHVRRWLAQEKYGVWQPEEGGGMSYRDWVNQVPVEEAQKLLDNYQNA